jgi:lipopolysaccharide export system ATP-binding protein
VSDSVLDAEGLRAVLGGNEVLRGVELSVPAGRVVGVLGPSGAGKTTLFRVIAGELPAQAGKVKILGRDVTRLPLWARARAGLGYVPQTPSVLFDLTVEDNLKSFERAAGVARIPVAERASEVELEGRLGVRAGELSGGERRRLEILRALIAAPRVLILDEPLTGVDPAAATRLVGIVRRRAEQGMAIVLADHRIGEALRMCDEALLLVDGRIELVAAPAEFSRHPAVLRRYLG